MDTSSATLGKLRCLTDNRSGSNSARTLTPASSVPSVQATLTFPPFVFADTKHLTRFKKIKAKRDAQGNPVRSDYRPGDGFSSSEACSAGLLSFSPGSKKRSRVENDSAGTPSRTQMHRLQLAVPDETGVHKSQARFIPNRDPPSSRSRKIPANLSNQSLPEHAVAGNTDSDALAGIQSCIEQALPKGATAEMRRVQVDARGAETPSHGRASTGPLKEAQDKAASQRVIAEASRVDARQVYLTNIEPSSLAPEAQNTSWSVVETTGRESSIDNRKGRGIEQMGTAEQKQLDCSKHAISSMFGLREVLVPETQYTGDHTFRTGSPTRRSILTRSKTMC